jgi:hypothetical protein
MGWLSVKGASMIITKLWKREDIFFPGFFLVISWVFLGSGFVSGYHRPPIRARTPVL